MSKRTSSVINSTTDTNAEAVDPNSVGHNSLANSQTSKMLYAHFRSTSSVLVAADLLINFHFKTYNICVYNVKIN